VCTYCACVRVSHGDGDAVPIGGAADRGASAAPPVTALNVSRRILALLLFAAIVVPPVAFALRAPVSFFQALQYTACFAQASSSVPYCLRRSAGSLPHWVASGCTAQFLSTTITVAVAAVVWLVPLPLALCLAVAVFLPHLLLRFLLTPKCKAVRVPRFDCRSFKEICRDARSALKARNVAEATERAAALRRLEAWSLWFNSCVTRVYTVWSWPGEFAYCALSWLDAVVGVCTLPMATGLTTLRTLPSLAMSSALSLLPQFVLTDQCAPSWAVRPFSSVDLYWGALLAPLTDLDVSMLRTISPAGPPALPSDIIVRVWSFAAALMGCLSASCELVMQCWQACTRTPLSAALAAVHVALVVAGIHECMRLCRYSRLALAARAPSDAGQREAISRILPLVRRALFGWLSCFSAFLHWSRVCVAEVFSAATAWCVTGAGHVDFGGAYLPPLSGIRGMELDAYLAMLSTLGHSASALTTLCETVVCSPLAAVAITWYLCSPSAALSAVWHVGTYYASTSVSIVVTRARLAYLTAMVLLLRVLRLLCAFIVQQFGDLSSIGRSLCCVAVLAVTYCAAFAAAVAGAAQVALVLISLASVYVPIVGWLRPAASTRPYSVRDIARTWKRDLNKQSPRPLNIGVLFSVEIAYDLALTEALDALGSGVFQLVEPEPSPPCPTCLSRDRRRGCFGCSAAAPAASGADAATSPASCTGTSVGGALCSS
jgi:hypothetical protein